MRRKRVWLSWSTGKDSAWALQELRQQPDAEVAALLTTVNAAFGRVSMHGVREILLEAQAAALGLPLVKVFIPYPCPNETYERAMSEAIAQARAAGITHLAFGDLYLEDVRRYRERMLAGTGIVPWFPLWGQDTTALAVQMVAAGLRAVVSCVDPSQLAAEFAGRQFDAEFLRGLPPQADPCGERGEFHTFAYAGPMFRAPVAVSVGEIVTRDGFVFADLLPAGTLLPAACQR
jgi:uncharacterized protein (TIGR00290 family)